MKHVLLLEWLGNLGVDKAPPAERDRVRSLNLRVAADFAFGNLFTVFWACVGARGPLTLSLLICGYVTLIWLSHFLGAYRAARFINTLVFPFVVALWSIVLGLRAGIDVFVFAGIASIYANYDNNEKKERHLALVATALLIASAHLYASHFGAIAELEEKWHGYMVSVAWLSSVGMFIMQIQIFLDKNEKIHKDLLEREAIASAVFEQAATGLNIVGPDGRFMKTNQEMCRMLGMTEEELLSQTVTSLSDPNDIEKTVHDINRVKKHEVEELKKEKRYRHKAGHYVTTHLQARALYHDNGDLKFFISSIQDLTESKQAEQKLLQASKMSSLGEMAGSIAHEINTPLAIIQVSAEQLEDPETRSQLTPDEIATYARTIGETVQRVAKIVKGLKAFARNADQDPLQVVPLADVISDSLELCKEKFRNQQIDIQVGIKDSISVSCRPTQISQVLLNLLSNAIDAVVAAQAKNESWVKVEASETNGVVSLRITDSGLGISKDVAERIFEPFFTTKPFGHGTGLGLSISKGIIESHHGRLYLDLSQARTCFVIDFPSVVRKSVVNQQAV